MIIDLQKFIAAERPAWEELEAILARLERDVASRLNTDEIRRFHYLYERVSADLARLATFAGERETRRYLETLVARAYGEIHETREKPHRLRPVRWFFVTLPRTFRAHLRAFRLSVAITLAGCCIGGMVLALDPDAKQVLLPQEHLLQNPSQRVAEEEQVKTDRLQGKKAQGAAWYMAHNTRVAIGVLALGITWGVGTMLLLFTNGLLLGAVVVDYVLGGETTFMLAWLLPHGSVEIPAILIAGQAGFLLASAVIGRRDGAPVATRLRRDAADIVTLIGGAAILLVWAGFVEAFLSQYHKPALPYAFKIALGVVEVALLILFLARAGRKDEDCGESPAGRGNG